MNIEDLMLEVINEGEDRLLECNSPSDRESKRTQAYFLKRKMGALASGVSISRVDSNGIEFLRLSMKPSIVAWKYDKEGKIVKCEPAMPAELARIVRLMKEDGQSEEAIKEMVDNWEESK